MISGAKQWVMFDSEKLRWAERIPQDTDVLYIALGCADHGHGEKRYQAFPAFMQQMIDEGQKVKMVVADSDYGGDGVNTRLPCAGFTQSALAKFLEANPRYRDNISVYQWLYLSNEESFIESFIQNPKHKLILLYFSDCPYQIDCDRILNKLLSDPAYLDKPNVHVLTYELPGPVYNWDSDALYLQSSSKKYIVSLKDKDLFSANFKATPVKPINHGVSSSVDLKAIAVKTFSSIVSQYHTTSCFALFLPKKYLIRSAEMKNLQRLLHSKDLISQDMIRDALRFDKRRLNLFNGVGSANLTSTDQVIVNLRKQFSQPLR